MTFAEWQQTYPGIRVSQPMKDAPEVYHVEGRDPLNQGGPTVFDAPMRALFDLSDYRVTADNAHRGWVFLAPRVDRDDWTRDDYMNHRIDHETYYLSLARLIGFEAIASYVRNIATPEQIARALDTERALNTIPLQKWDALHDPIRRLVAERNRERGIMARSWCGQPLQPGTICWSMSESVCVAKAVARAMVAKEDASV
jgi:hypothetical protein